MECKRLPKMQIMFGTILCVLLKGLILTKAITLKDDNTSNILEEESISTYPDLNLTQDISMPEINNHIVNFKSDRSHSVSTVRNELKVDEVTLPNISILQGSFESSLNKPPFLRAFVQFDNQIIEKVNDISVTLRWDESEFTDEIIIQKYTVQCFFIEDLKKIQICENKNVQEFDGRWEYTVHNLTFNTTYYFRIRKLTNIGAGSYTDLISVSTTHENPIPKLLFPLHENILEVDMDLNKYTDLYTESLLQIIDVAYSIQEDRIYWITRRDLMTIKIINGEKNITKIYSSDFDLHNLCIDWVARNLYFTFEILGYINIVKFDLTMWKNGIIKFFRVFMDKNFMNSFDYFNVLPSMGILYGISYNWENKKYDIMKYDLDRKKEQIVEISDSYFSLYYTQTFNSIIIDNMNNEELIYWLNDWSINVTDINISKFNQILHKHDINDDITFQYMTIDKANIYIFTYNSQSEYIIYILKKKYASFNCVNATECVKKITRKYFLVQPVSKRITQSLKCYAFDKSSQPYPSMRCLTPDEKVYNFENVTATANSIIVNLPEPVVKSGCKKYNLPTTIYTISVSHCVDKNLNKSEEFNVLTGERYEIENLTPFTEYELKLTLSNFYFDQLSINPFYSNVTRIKTDLDKLNVPENISVLALTPTITVVYWMPPKKLNCAVVTYEVHWKLVNDTQENKQFINVPKRIADGRFFTKINLSLPVQDDLIYVRVYPSNFSDFYNESLNKTVYIYSEPNNITLSEANTNSMNISWISNINLTIFFALEYKNILTKKWQTTNETRTNYNEEVIYHIKNLQSGISYQFRLILRYPEYEETFTWPADKRFIFSTHISDTPEIISMMLGFIVIATIICLFYFYYFHRQSRSNNDLTTIIDVELGILYDVSCEYSPLNTIYSPMLHYNPDECAITKIARKQIIFTKLIGSGQFGMVYHGKIKNLESSGTEISVAIKTLWKDPSSHEKKKLLKEAELMNRFRHKHILRLLGVCLDGIFPFLVLELMETDLLKYLRDHRNLEASDSHALRLQDLFAMCKDVARGCCYLEELRFVHRDLACRNCLVSLKNREDRIIKIGDFGLTRNIYPEDYYRMRGEDLLPVRWMAPESLMMRLFTSQSDIWSFGVVMWEITSLGEQPYSGKSNEEVINYVVRTGGRLPITLNCPSPLYRLMNSCWSAADARPNFNFCLNSIITLRKNIGNALLNPIDS